MRIAHDGSVPLPPMPSLSLTRALLFGPSNGRASAETHVIGLGTVSLAPTPAPI